MLDGTYGRPSAPSVALLVDCLQMLVDSGFGVPLNKQIQSSTIAVPPSHWQQIRDLWLQRHLLHALAVALAFFSAPIAPIF
jgi:hypothetical protein